MRTILLALALAACGGKTPPPANTTTTPPEPTTKGEPPAAASCCCELPADPPVFETQPEEKCQTDSHGVCVAADKCGAAK
jgi:hypothetical protein